MFHVRDDYLGELWGVSVIGTAMVEGSTSVTGKYGFLPWDGVYVAYYQCQRL
jgi:hypothetical protein